LSRRAAYRSSLAAIPGAIFGAFAIRHGRALLPSVVVLATMAAIMLLQLFSTGVLYGLGLFRASSVGVGIIRSAASPGLVVVAVMRPSSSAILAWLLVIETSVLVLLAILAVRAYTRLPAGDGPPPIAQVRGTYWLGLGSAVNVLINRSDSFLVSLASPSQAMVGMYAIASQVENAIATVALAPSSSLQRHVTIERERGRHARREVLHVGALVAALAVLLGLGVLGVSAAWCTNWVDVPFLGRPSWQLWFVLAFSCLSSVASASAGVLLSSFVGIGQHQRVGRTWMLTAVTSIPCMLLLPRLLGVFGALVGALVRDFLVLLLALDNWRKLGTGRHVATAVVPGRPLEALI